MEIPVKIKGLLRKRDTDDVEFCEVLGNSTLIHFFNGDEARMRCSLTEFVKKYGSPQGIISAHRKYVVNLRLVNQRIKYCLCEMQCGKKIELGREADKIISDYLSRKGKKTASSN